MSNQSPSRDKGHYLALVLAFILVMVGLINTMPEYQDCKTSREI